MERSIGEMNLKEVRVFINDLNFFIFIVGARTVLEVCFAKAERLWTKFSTRILIFFQTSVRYLSHGVSETGVETDLEKVRTLTTWPIPSNLRTPVFSWLCWVLQKVHSGILSCHQTPYGINIWISTRSDGK